MYCYHLRKPVDRRRCENESSIGYILISLLGIGILDHECSFFERGQDHKQRFINSWPQILKWLKAVFDGHHFHGDEAKWFGAVEGVFRVFSFVGGEALDKDDAFEFAVDVWNGFRASDGREYFSPKPLFKCLSREIEGDARIDYILKGYKKNTKLLVNKILSRIKHAISHPSPRETDNPGPRFTTKAGEIIPLRWTSKPFTILSLS